MSEKEAFQKKFGQHLRDFRERKGMSIRDMEIAGDIDRAVLSRIETGKQTVTVVTFHKILKILNASESEFYVDFD